MWVGSLAETLLDPAVTTPRDNAIGCGKATSAAWWGFFWWFFLYIMSIGKGDCLTPTNTNVEADKVGEHRPGQGSPK